MKNFKFILDLLTIRDVECVKNRRGDVYQSWDAINGDWIVQTRSRCLRVKSGRNYTRMDKYFRFNSIKPTRYGIKLFALGGDMAYLKR